MNVSELKEHMREKVRDKVVNSSSGVYDIANATGLTAQRLYNFVNGHSRNPLPAFLDVLTKYFYPDFEVVLGEEITSRYVPPRGWLVHPQDARFFYNLASREVLTEQQLRDKVKAEAISKMADVVRAKIIEPQIAKQAAE